MGCWVSWPVQCEPDGSSRLLLVQQPKYGHSGLRTYEDLSVDDCGRNEFIAVAEMIPAARSLIAVVEFCG
jgi:hypothetical protein